MGLARRAVAIQSSASTGRCGATSRPASRPRHQQSHSTGAGAGRRFHSPLPDTSRKLRKHERHHTKDHRDAHRRRSVSAVARPSARPRDPLLRRERERTSQSQIGSSAVRAGDFIERPTMTRRTVLLVAPPVLHAKTWWGNRIANKPHLASLSGYVRDVAEVRILELDITIEDDSAALLRVLDEQLDDSVGLVGISCWTSLHYLGTLAAARRVRRLAPDIPIVVGGHHPTARPSDFCHAICDWVVRGDGEHVMRSLCTQWPRRPNEMSVIAGRPFDQSNPDDVDWERYGRPGARVRALWVGASRGCGFQCRFCVEPQRGA